MKKFKFNLEAVLKVRKLKEDIKKSEVGRVQQQITHFRNLIVQEHEAISSTYFHQEGFLGNHSQAQNIQFLPETSEAKRMKILRFKEEINHLEEVLAEKRTELAKLVQRLKFLKS